jgi:hypothetical protein
LFPFETEAETDGDTALDALGELLRKGATMKLGVDGAEVEIG